MTILSKRLQFLVSYQLFVRFVDKVILLTFRNKRTRENFRVARDELEFRLQFADAQQLHVEHKLRFHPGEKIKCDIGELTSSTFIR